jgi:glutamate/tyrosine decarboxylase-like PLP-dependent enzyme
MATAWAVMHHLGIDGYKDLTARTIDAARRMADGIRAIDGLCVLGEPEAQIVATAAAPGWEDRVDVFAVGDALLRRGWFLDRQMPPDSLHATVCAANAPVIDDYLSDLAASVDEVQGERAEDRSTNYSTLE